MNFELTISGLCVIAMQVEEKEGIPEAPQAVDIICPRVPSHCARFSYLPGDVVPQLEVSMVVDNTGRRIASLDLTDEILQIAFDPPPGISFFVHVGDPDLKVPPPSEVMNFVPTLEELGFNDFTMPPDGELPQGAGARVSLPPGEIFADDIVNDADTGMPLLWKFPKKEGLTRALANHVVYRALNVGDLTITKRDGKTVFQASSNGTVRMSLSNDDCNMPLDYNDPVDALRDLKYLEVLAESDGPFEPPEIDDGEHTGRPICNQVIFVYEAGEGTSKWEPSKSERQQSG